MKALLSIVIVNSNGKEDTLNCIDTVFKNPCADKFEIILIDNLSDDGCVEEVKKKFPEVVIQRSPIKGGFSQNYNRGIQLSKGDYILILNNDTLVLPGALDSMMSFIKSEKFAMIGPLLLNARGSVDFTCARKRLTLVRFILNELFLEIISPLLVFRKIPEPGEVEAISGACMLTSRETIEKTGALSEKFQFYFEDIEWCDRIRKHGLRIGFDVESRIIHLGDRSAKKVKEWALKRKYESALLFFGEGDHGAPRRVLLKALFPIIYLCRAFVLIPEGLIEGTLKRSRLYWHMYIWSLMQIKTSQVGVSRE